MVLTQRERYIAIGLAASLAVLLVTWSLVKYIGGRRDLTDEMNAKMVEKKNIEVTLGDQARVRKDFKQMITDGLKNSQSEAKGQIRDALDQWAPASGVNENTLSDGQVTHDADFDQITFKLSGTGTQATIVKLLNQCETTTLPLRVTKIVLSPVQEARDYVKFELTVSTICQAEKSRPRAGAAAPIAAGERS
jgi:hypothetical protein